jgi:hypothetical protein
MPGLDSEKIISGSLGLILMLAMLDWLTLSTKPACVCPVSSQTTCTVDPTRIVCLLCVGYLYKPSH